MARRVVITGAFSNTGAAVAALLLRHGCEIHTLTRRAPLVGLSSITHAPLLFEPQHLRRELEGAEVFINTYWVRFAAHGCTFGRAVDNIRLLIEAAKEARVTRFVHVSVSNAARGAHLGYYRGKADAEELLRRSGLSYAIVRPTLVVGPSDVLTHNIAWFLRRFPVFFVPRDGAYRLQPVTLNDNAGIIADCALAKTNQEVDAAGPETFTFRDYLGLLATAAGVRPLLIPTPNFVALAATHLVGLLLGDVVLAREELLGLEGDLLTSSCPALGTESVREWLLKNGRSLGRRYIDDTALHARTERGSAI
jgi:uncharacterized protein YbjT (DUF2867 family)